MKRILLVGLIILLVLGSGLSFLVIKEKILIRSPLLIQQNAKITFIMGETLFRAPGETKWNPAVVGTELKEDYEVKTESNALMDIRFHTGMALRVPSETQIKIGRLTIKKLIIQLFRGSIYGKFEKLYKSHSIQVKTPTIVASIRGTELGFELDKVQVPEKNPKEDGTEKSNTENVPAAPTTVYALSGITEIYNLNFTDQKILLSYQKKLKINENSPPGDPEQLKDSDVTRIRNILNSIHQEEVLLITDKINFEVGSSKILKESFTELNKIALMLKKKSSLVRIEGHTDNKGNDSDNLQLSVRRAQSIKEYLVKQGVKEKYLLIAGFGESRPIASNDTEKGRALNRRVEFLVVEK